MALKIEDYALIGDCHTAALVGNDGSIDWLCMPRFDSASVFGALLGDPDHGRWKLAPTQEVVETSRHYLEDTFILVTRWVTKTGEVEVTDFMPYGDRRADLARRVKGISGSVELAQELRVRFEYAEALPWVRQTPEKHDNALIAVAGPDAIIMRGPRLNASDNSHTSTFTVKAGESVDLSMTWYPSHREPPGHRTSMPDLPGPRNGGVTGHRHRRRAPSTRRRCAALSSSCVRSPTKTPVESWRPRRRVSLKTSAAAATGTIAMSGCATPHRPCTCFSTTEPEMKRPPGATGSCAPSPETRPTCRSCT